MSDVEYLEHSTVTLIDCNASDEKVARAAWVSQNPGAHEKEADEGRVEKLIDFLWRNRHTSPFEHGQFTFVIETPIFVAREFMRHRTMSFNEVSGRYTEMQPRFYLPNMDRPTQQTGKVGSYTFEADLMQSLDARLALRSTSERAWTHYKDLKESGVANEVARMVLPVNLMTTFWATANPRNLMHFLNLRTDPQALHEIREVANLIAEHLENEMPLTYKAWRNHG